jgi:NADH:ubiquinone oxidoreductase subunit 3 (subunit A)
MFVKRDAANSITDNYAVHMDGIYGKIFSREDHKGPGSLYNFRGECMLNDWLFVGIFLILAPVFPALALVIPRLVAPRKPNPIKLDTYECGLETYGETWVQFKAQYYIYALVFLVFDIEVVFLFPWAAAFNQLPLFAVIEGILFILILVAGLVYTWRKGILEWA